MVSVTPASRYHPRYQSRSSMYIRGMVPRNFAELAEAVPITVHIFRLYNVLAKNKLMQFKSSFMI